MFMEELNRSVITRSGLDEPGRLDALDASGLLDSPTEARFDRLTRLVQKAVGVPVALVSLVTPDRQFFKSSAGLPEPWASARETPLSHSFCQHVVTSRAALVVEDALKDERVAGNKACTDLGVAAYLGVPVRGPEGEILGSLCAISGEPRVWRDTDVAILTEVAGVIEDLIAAEEGHTRWRRILNAVPNMLWSTAPDGSVDYFNDRWFEFTGADEAASLGDAWLSVLHPEDVARTVDTWRRAVATGEPYAIEYRLRHVSGGYRWALGLGLPMRGASGTVERWFGTCTDIHDRWEAVHARELLVREMAHRTQNLLAVVTSLVSGASRTHPEAVGFARGLNARLNALAIAHRLATRDLPQPGIPKAVASTLAMLGEVLAPYRDDAGGNVTIGGDDLAVTADAASAIALVFHELATNAVKYGAFCVPSGHVTVTARRAGGTYTIGWCEQGGPPLAEVPQGTGFGSKLMATVMLRFSGSLTRTVGPEGFVVTVSAPLDKIGAG